MDIASLGMAVQTAYWLVLGLLSLFGLHRLHLVWMYWRRGDFSPRPRRDNHDAPLVTVQLPIYNEPSVARRVIEAATRMDWPVERLEIQVLDDSDDRTRVIVDSTVNRCRAQGRNVTVVRRPVREGYKAGALAHGLKSANGDFFAIFDADFVPPSDFLRRTIGAFDDASVGVVQTRWEHLNRDESWLTRAQAALLDGHFIVEHTARNRNGLFMGFNGTAGVWRRTAINDAGGWNHDTLTEDLDLSYRAQLRGWKFVYLPEVTAPAELPAEMSAFRAQQRRWTQGGAQTCVKLLGRVLRAELPWRVKLEAVFHLTGFAVYPLVVALTLLVGPTVWFRALQTSDPGPATLGIDALLFAVATGSTLAFYIVSQRSLGRPWGRVLGELPLLMGLGVGIAASNASAALRGLVTRAGEFVRTPKYGAGGRRVAPKRVHWPEAILSTYVACFATLIVLEPQWIERAFAAMPFLAIFVFGNAYVALHAWLNSSQAPARVATEHR